MKPVRVLGREYSIDILGATEEPRSAANLSDSLGVPIATCYRRIDELAAVGLLEEVATDGDDAPRATQYRRTTDAMYVEFAPTPSFSTWTLPRRAVDADTVGDSHLKDFDTPGCRESSRRYSQQYDVSAPGADGGDETTDRIRAAVSGVSGSNAAAAVDRQGPVEDDA